MSNFFQRICHRRGAAWSLSAAAAAMLSIWPVEVVHAAKSQPQHEVVGRWRLTAAIDGAEMVSLDEHEARRLVGKTFLIENNRIQFRDSVCPSPDFSTELVEPRLYLAEYYHASAEKLGLPNPVAVVHLDCTSVFVKNHDRLVIAWKGWFFDATRIKR